MDGTTKTEREAIEWLSVMGIENNAAAAATIAMPWMRDDATEAERDALEWLRWLAKNSDAAWSALFATPWVQDGIIETERIALGYLGWIAHRNEKAAVTVSAMPWVQDDITETETTAIRSVDLIGGRDSAAMTAIIAMPWIQDSITKTEADALKYLSWISGRNSDAAAALVAMPFLKSLDPDDVLAIRGIQRLARDEDDSLLATLMNHPTLRNGITDAQAILVAAAGTLWDPEEVRRFLNPGYADIETLSKGTELTPNLRVSIVAPGFGLVPQTTEVIWSAVTFPERTMGTPLPVSHVIVVLSDKTGTKGLRTSANLGHAISILPSLAQEHIPYHTYLLGTHSTHETAHFYWIGNEGWINEGSAKVIEWMYGVENSATPGMLTDISRNWGCADAHDLAGLTSMNLDFRSQAACNHFLGYALFKELFDSLGPEEFMQRLRQLYSLSLEAKDAGKPPGIVEVRQAFHDFAEIVERHWSGKLNAPENRPFDEGGHEPNHGLIQWKQHPTYDGRHVTFSGTLLGDAVLSRETLHEARSGSGLQNFDLYLSGEGGFEGRILPPGHSSTLRYTGDNTATEYRLEGRTFTVKFPFPKALGNPSDYVVHVWGYRDESRTAFIYEHTDRLGYARIRAE